MNDTEQNEQNKEGKSRMIKKINQKKINGSKLSYIRLN